MSEVKLNLVDAEQTLVGTVHGSLADACVAALSAEPETIADLKAALARYVKPVDQLDPLNSFHIATEVDSEPRDAGVVIIDLDVRVVAAESSYSQPQPEGEVLYHDGTQSTDISVLYRVPGDWKFLDSIVEYEPSRRRRQKRMPCPPLDARNVLYGRALLEFIVTNVRQSSVCRDDYYSPICTESSPSQANDEAVAGQQIEGAEERTSREALAQEAIANEISAIHARWLMTPREDLRAASPRDVLLAKREFIDFDLHTRELQWSFQGEGPPCLTPQSFAYRFAGFGTHECVVYYDLVRHLLWSALENLRPTSTSRGHNVSNLRDSNRVQQTNELLETDLEVPRLEQIETAWLENPQPEFSGRTPASTIENERRRLPLALSRREMIIDDDCYTCVMMANDPTMGPGFWHLDGSHMDDDFAFSDFLTRDEWEAENHRREEFNKEFNRRWEERQQRLARGEEVDTEFDLDWIDSLNQDRRDSGPADDDGGSADLIQ